jgi:hypothetical protein
VEGQSVLELLADALGQNDDPNVRNLERQFLPQFQQLLKVELAFVHRLCGPDREELLEVATAARARLGIAVKRYAVAQNQMRQRRVRGASPAWSEPITLIQQQVAAIVEEKLRPEQARRYEEECAHRTARRKRAVVLNLVARMDEDLRLTTDQREQLVRLLTAGYQESWAQWLQLLAHDAQAMPNIPDHCVLPALSEDQKAVWRQTSKSGYVTGGLPFAPAMMVVEDPVLEEL